MFFSQRDHRVLVPFNFNVNQCSCSSPSFANFFYRKSIIPRSLRCCIIRLLLFIVVTILHITWFTKTHYGCKLANYSIEESSYQSWSSFKKAVITIILSDLHSLIGVLFYQLRFGMYFMAWESVTKVMYSSVWRVWPYKQ